MFTSLLLLICLRMHTELQITCGVRLPSNSPVHPEIKNILDWRFPTLINNSNPTMFFLKKLRPGQQCNLQFFLWNRSHLPIFINWTPGAGVEPPPACHLPCGFATGPLPNSHATFNSWLNGWKRVNLSMFLVNLFTFQSHLIVILAQCMDKTAPLNDLQSLQYTVIASDLLPAASRSGRGIAVSSDWDWTPQLPERAILYVSPTGCNMALLFRLYSL